MATAELMARAPRLEPRQDDDAGLDELGEPTGAGIHDPEYMPFAVPWTDAPAEELSWRALRFRWRLHAAIMSLAFDHRGARRVETSAWHDNAPSLGVSRALGYRRYRTTTERRRGKPTQMIWLSLDPQPSSVHSGYLTWKVPRPAVRC